MIACRSNERAVFLFGFAKNERENVTPDELGAFRELARAWLGATALQIAQAVSESVLLEVSDE